MKRDALPQHEIDLIVQRLKRGEPIKDIYDSMAQVVTEAWFERNAPCLYALAGVDPEQLPAPQRLENALEQPEPTEATVPAAEPDDVFEAPPPEPPPPAAPEKPHKHRK